MVDEKKLLEKLKKKDVRTLEQAIKNYTPYLSTVLYNLAGNRLSKEDGEEIISDVFITLWKNVDYINLEKGTVRSYIAAVARNLALRRINREVFCSPLDDIGGAQEHDSIEEKLVSDALWNAVKELGETDFEIFVRRYKYDEKIRTIAKAMEMNESTIKTHLMRGKKKLKELLKEEWL
ncbi:MAG: sigma-70 family RNA polymerase sigma factor [Clostridia bacterium]|nr:sigma-70 family RNA polymerase sigma factor [Clostridia bacterium]